MIPIGERAVQWLRDNVDIPTKPVINRAIGCVQTMRDAPRLVDQALEKKYGG